MMNSKSDLEVLTMADTEDNKILKVMIFTEEWRLAVLDLMSRMGLV